MSAVSRLHDAVQRPHKNQFGLPMRLVIEYAHAVELDQIIHDLCLDETECSICEARICRTCGIEPDAYDCADEPEVKHCPVCVGQCRWCRDAMREDVR